MDLNKVEKELKKLYENWGLGNQIENSSKYSAMFRMGFPNEYIDSEKPLLMYVGQECLHGNKEKTQAWIREYQNVQRTKKRITNDWFDYGTNRSPFWNFFRRLSGLGINVLWNNLDKFHPANAQRLSWEDGVKFNSSYGDDKLSILQREIKLLKPKVIVFVIGNGKYTASLASAFSVSEKKLMKYEPNPQEFVSEASDVLGLENTIALWTYHPAFLQRSGKYQEALSIIEKQFKDRKV
ncbi:MAG: hypothetical protein IJZ51_03150 [Ruminiclostridium sp.]|nr:hypothetical protein [Ruminiclostridium sp.]